MSTTNTPFADDRFIGVAYDTVARIANLQPAFNNTGKGYCDYDTFDLAGSRRYKRKPKGRFLRFQNRIVAKPIEIWGGNRKQRRRSYIKTKKVPLSSIVYELQSFETSFEDLGITVVRHPLVVINCT